jgi:tripartite-type tricarboxylate transporter receptor subunit TctC
MGILQATKAALLCVTLAAAGVLPAAQPFPERPIRLVVPFPPGTASDFLGRTLGAALTERYKMQVVVDNRPGAGGLVGTPIVLTALPNGHTLGLFGPPYITSVLLQAKAPYRPLEDGAPVVQIAGIPNVIGITLHLPAKTLQEFAAHARTRPGALNYASVGVGSIAHFGAEIFVRAAKINAVHVPFKSLGDGWGEIFAGRVHFFVFAAPAAVPMVRDGRVRALAVTTPRRIAALPDLPTVAEAGLPAAEHVAWFGIFAPAGTPRALVAKLAADISAVVRDPKVREQFERQGADPVGDSSPETFAKLLKAEYARYAQLIRDAGIKPQ